jgi:hypothetical protein
MENHATDRAPYVPPELFELGRAHQLTLGVQISANSDAEECRRFYETFVWHGPSQY